MGLFRRDSYLVKQLRKGDPDVKVEVAYPQYYADYCIKVTRAFTSAFIHTCLAAKELGQDVVDFTFENIPIPVTRTLETTMPEVCNVGLTVKISRKKDVTSARFSVDVSEMWTRNGEDGE